MTKPLFIAIIISILATVWVVSGMVGKPENAAGTPAQSELQTTDNIPEVRVQNLSAEAMNDKIEVTGRTQAARQVNLSAETDGQVATILVEKGQIVKEGDVLAKLAVRDRSARLTEAQQLVNQRDIQYKAAKELEEKGFNSRVRLSESIAQLESAKAQLKIMEVELSNITIKAPFDGVINGQMVEVGDYVSKGTQMFDIVDLNPIEIVGFLTEKQMEYVTEGSDATAELLRGEEVSGKITFIASAANAETRTFQMEITVDNPEHKIKEGITAKLKIPTQEARAYKISPSILSLADDGTVGVKIVNADNIVEFMPIDILKDTPEYLWVGGLPESVQIITVGQDFVVTGQKVKPVVSEGKSLL